MIPSFWFTPFAPAATRHAMVLLLYFSICCPGSTNAVEKTTYKRIPTQEKSQDADLTFSLTFDGKSVAADQSLGNPDSQTFGDGNLEFRIVPGFDG